MRNSYGILKISILLLLMFQASEAADTLRIHVVIKHLLNKSGQPYNYKTITQQFYTSEGLFFREINYNDSTGELSNFSFLFYQDNKLLTREFYDAKNNLQYILHYGYDERGNVKVLTHLLPDEQGKFNVAEKHVNVYKENQKVKYKHFTGKKADFNSRYIYDVNGKLLQEKTLYKQGAKSTIKQEIIEYSYTPEGKTETINLYATDWTGRTTQSKEELKYKDERLISVKLFNDQGSQTGERIYKYFKNGEISWCEELDSTGVKCLMLQYEYKKNYMEMGIQKSQYENL